MNTNRKRSGRHLGPAIRGEVEGFLRRWLPDLAKDVYREMIRNDPTNWFQHPHFSSGLIVKHALRGNGINEKTTGMRDLNAIWPELLLAALLPSKRLRFLARSKKLLLPRALIHCGQIATRLLRLEPSQNTASNNKYLIRIHLALWVGSLPGRSPS